MNPDTRRGVWENQRRLDRVLIAAAVTALFGRNAKVRRIRQVAGGREGAWTREGRLATQVAHRMGAPLIRAAAARRTANA
jgi:hypothetical protein